MVKITQGKVKRPLRIVVCGVEGIGKSTFASKYPDPLFIDLEGGTDSMDVKRTQRPQTWAELLQLIREIVADPSVCRTLVIDTGDQAESLCIKYICWKYKKDGLEEFGYGKGYVYLREEFEALLNELDKAVAAGINVVVTAHTHIRKFEQPDEQGAYDRYELKMSKNVAPLLKEWTDILLFANYKTFVITTETNSHKVAGGKRVMYATHNPCWDAKNRHGLPDEMDFDFKYIAHLFTDAPQAEQPPMERLRTLMEKAHITDAEIQRIVSEKGHYPADKPLSEYEEKFVEGWLIRHWDQIVPIIEAQRNKEQTTTETSTEDGGNSNG